MAGLDSVYELAPQNGLIAAFRMLSWARLLAALERRPLWNAAAIFLLAFTLRAFLWFHRGPHEVFDQVEVVQTAMCFARNGFLGNPFIRPTGPTAHVTPAFPFLIGLMYRWAPSLQTGENLKNLLTMVIASLQFAFLPLLARAARIGISAGTAAGLIGALVPILYLDCSGDFEAPLVGLTLVLAAIASLSLRERYRDARIGSLLTGLVWGATALVSMQLLLSGTAYELLIRLHKRAAQQLAFLAVGLVVAVLPWTIRNYVELGSPVISRDNAGIELHVSNNDDAAVTFDENLQRRVLYRLHPHSNPAEAELVRQLGEVRYNKLKQREAETWIKSHPGHFLDLTAHRFVAFWFMSGRGLVIGVYWRLLLLFGFVGLWLCWRSRRGSLLLFCVLLAVYPLPHYIVQASERYRYPLNVVLLLFSGYAVIWLLSRTQINGTSNARTT